MIVVEIQEPTSPFCTTGCLRSPGRSFFAKARVGRDSESLVALRFKKESTTAFWRKYLTWEKADPPQRSLRQTSPCTTDRDIIKKYWEDPW